MKVFWGNVFASLIATFLWKYIAVYFETGLFLKWKGVLDVITNYSFLIYWAIILILFLFIFIFLPQVTKKRIENNQDKPPGIIGIKSRYDKEDEIKHLGLYWIILYDITRRDHTKEIEKVRVGIAKGPYCKNEKRQMKESRTYFGRYKYKCPKCGFKKILLENSYTLKKDVMDEFESQYR